MSQEPPPPPAPPSGYGTPPAAPPPVSGGPPAYGAPPAYDAPPPPMERPGHLTAAAIILIVLGVLVSLLAVIFILGGLLVGAAGDIPEFAEQFGPVSDAIGGFIVGLGVVILAYGVLKIVTGIYVLAGKSWARITGMILAILGGLFSLLGLFPTEDGGPGGVIVSLVLLAAYVYSVWALATHGRWFAGR